jgi:hypothetical protein
MNSRARIGWLQTSIVALLLVFGLGGFAAAQNLPDFFHIQNQPATIGKLKADNFTVTCTHVIQNLAAICTDGSYAAQCVSGICGCINYTCTNAGGTMGTANATLEIGFDLGNGPAGGAPDCYPIFGFVTGTGKKDLVQEETDFDGVVCDPLTGQVAQANGGWQLFQADNPLVVHGAGGTFTGTLNLTSSALKLSFKGKTF